MNSGRARRIGRVGWGLAGLAVALGCGTDEYERRLEQSVQQWKYRAPYANLSADYTAIPDTAAAVRLPNRQEFTRAFNEQSPDPTTGQGVISPTRVQPPFFPLPGFKVCYEPWGATEATGNVCYYLYLAVPPADAKFDLAAVAEQLKASVPESEVKVEDLTLTSPEGQPVPVKRLTLTSPKQLFYSRAVGREEEMPGTLLIYSHPVGNDTALLVWRYPSGLKAAAELVRETELVSGTLTVVPAEAAPGS